MTVSAPSTVLLMGRHSTGKRTIASSFIGKDRAELVERKRWVSQLKGTKGEVTIQGLPEEHGRMSAYRQRIAAINEANAFVIVVRNSEPVHYQYYHELVQKNIKEGTAMGPFVVIAGYITDEVPELNPGIAEWAKSINAKVELLNVTKVNQKDAAESKKVEAIIHALVQATQAPALPEPEPMVTEPTPIGAAIPIVAVAPKEDKPAPKPQPQPSAVSRALSYLVKGGSVA